MDESLPRKSQLDLFMQMLPTTLYQNHYRLAEMFHHTGYTAEQWRNFLKEHDHFIRTEVSAITEAEARSAIQRLSEGNAKSADISAIKQILEQSELLNQKTKDARTFVVTNMPQPNQNQQTEAEQRSDMIRKNMQNVKTTFDDLGIYGKENVHQNADGTIHLRPPISAVDHAYLRLFNPTNAYIERLAPLDQGQGDIQ